MTQTRALGVGAALGGRTCARTPHCNRQGWGGIRGSTSRCLVLSSPGLWFSGAVVGSLWSSLEVVDQT